MTPVVPELVSLAHAEDAAIAPGDSAEALRKRGVALVYSSNRVTDETLEGVALLEQAARDGSAEAEVTLGGLYLYGTLLEQDWPRALEHFERAAAMGDPSGIAQYGTMLMWSERDWPTAQALLERAAAAGVVRAWATLAEGAMYGYLGGGSTSRQKFDGYAAQGRAAGVARIDVLDAIRHMWGISVTASGPQTLAILRTAAEQGNAEAAAYLIRLLRDGNKYNIRRDRPGARAALDTFSGLFDEAGIWQQDMALVAAEATTPEAWDALNLSLARYPERVTRAFGGDLMKANLNATIYLLQLRLAPDYPDIVPDGFAGRATLRAIYAACVDTVQPALCDDSLLQPDVLGPLLAAR